MSDANEPDIDDDDEEKGGNVREQDRFLPIANISRIMKKALPANCEDSERRKRNCSRVRLRVHQLYNKRSE